VRLSGPTPVYPVLFAAYFVLFLMSQNLTEVTFDEVLPVLVVAIVAAAIATAVAGILLRSIRRGAIVAGALVIAFFAYGHVANALYPRVGGFVQQIAWVAFVVVALVLAVRIGRRLVPLTTALNLVGGLLVVTTLATIIPHELNRPAAGAVSALPSIDGVAASGPKRDIYYLIFDRYGDTDEMKKHYGIDNPLNAYLESKGFYVADDAHANYVKTQLSIASSLNMSYLDKVGAQMGPDSSDESPIYEMMQAHAIARFIKSQGYKYVQIGSRFKPTNVNSYADENPQPDSLSDFSSALIDTSAIPPIARRLGLTRSTPQRERYWNTARFQFRILGQELTNPGPKLVFCHFLLPHPPYVFAADGSLVTHEDVPSDMAHEYAGMVTYANSQIMKFVDSVMKLPEEQRPIIVLAADEGPYPARYNVDTNNFDWAQSTNDELRLKYGILNAFYMPGLADTGLYKTITPVNDFRLIFSKYFGADLPLLPDRIYTSKAKARPYDFTDVTDRITQP
jgi:Sulfatase